jgi:hypothetical protein
MLSHINCIFTAYAVHNRCTALPMQCTLMKRCLGTAYTLLLLCVFTVGGTVNGPVNGPVNGTVNGTVNTTANGTVTSDRIQGPHTS